MQRHTDGRDEIQIRPGTAAFPVADGVEGHTDLRGQDFLLHPRLFTENPVRLQITAGRAFSSVFPLFRSTTMLPGTVGVSILRRAMCMTSFACKQL